MSTVSYHRVFDLGNYENERIGFDLPIEPGESTSDALARVKTIVMECAGKSQEYKKLEQRRNATEHALYTLRQLKEAVKRHDELRIMLATHGITIDELDSWYRANGTEAAEEIEADTSDDDYEDEDGDQAF